MALITASDIRWLSRAISQAEQAPHEQWRVGAALVKGGRLLSVGFNRYRNDPSQVDLSGVSYHAEAVAIRRAGFSEGATLYVARVTRSGDMGSAKPCARCQLLLSQHGVHTVVWSTPVGVGKSRVRALSLAS